MTGWKVCMKTSSRFSKRKAGMQNRFTDKRKEEYHVAKIRADAFKSRKEGIFPDYVCNACHSYLSCDNAVSLQQTVDLDGRGDDHDAGNDSVSGNRILLSQRPAYGIVLAVRSYAATGSVDF